MHNPLWFLVLALFLPRLALFIGWFDGWSFGIHPPLAALLLWAFLPRVLVLISVYSLQGVGFWFFLHLLAAAIAWSGSSRVVYQRRGRRRERLD
jgi:hypothetical protein